MCVSLVLCGVCLGMCLEVNGADESLFADPAGELLGLGAVNHHMTGVEVVAGIGLAADLAPGGDIVIMIILQSSLKDWPHFFQTNKARYDDAFEHISPIRESRQSP